MKTDAQRDAELAHVADMIEALCNHHGMQIASYGEVYLEHRQLDGVKYNTRELKLNPAPF